MSVPFLSIIIPTRNRESQLKIALQSLDQQIYPYDKYEVIIVNDGGEPLQLPLAAQSKRLLQTVEVLQPHSGPAMARNRGAAIAKGEFLLFLDDDCAATPSWLATVSDNLCETPNYMLGGRTLNRLTNNLYSTASQILLTYLYEYYNPFPNQARFFASNNIAVQKELFNELNGFDACFTRAAAEDRDFCDRWLAHGYKMRYISDAVIYHAHSLTLRTFWRQHFNYGRGAFHFHKARANRINEPVQVEPLSFYLNLLVYPFSRSPKGKSSWLAMLLLLSQVANAAGFFWERVLQE